MDVFYEKTKTIKWIVFCNIILKNYSENTGEMIRVNLLVGFIGKIKIIFS